jgi:hypothetical protein
VDSPPDRAKPQVRQPVRVRRVPVLEGVMPVVNTLAVFALAAAAGIGMIIGTLVGMCWVEQRAINNLPSRRQRSASVVDERPVPRAESGARALKIRQRRFAAEYRRRQAVLRARVMRQTRKAGLMARSAVLAVVALVGAALSVGWHSSVPPATIERGRRLPAQTRARAGGRGVRTRSADGCTRSQGAEISEVEAR